MNVRLLRTTVVAVVALAACSADTLAPTEARRPASDVAPELLSEGEGVFQRYVAIGTSISMTACMPRPSRRRGRRSWPGSRIASCRFH